MKKLILLLLAVTSLSAQTLPKNVQKVSTTNAITENLVIPTGKTLTPSGSGTITATALSSTAAITGVIPIANLATGTPTGAKFVRDDGTLATPAGATPTTTEGDIIVRGTSADQRLAIGTTGQVLTVDTAVSGKLKYSTISGTGTVTSVDITPPAAGITVSGGPITTSGSITLALANDLAALEGLSSTGMAARTGTSTWAVRTLAGTANEITATNGDGVSGAPTFSLPTALTFTGKTVTGGTFVSGAFNGTLGATTPSSVVATTINSTGIVTQAGGSVDGSPSALATSGAVNIDFSKRLSTQALTGNSTWSYTGSPANNQSTNIEVSTDSTARVITLPANTFEPNKSTATASFTVAASTVRLPLQIKDIDGTNFLISGIPVSTTGSTGVFVLQTSPTLITPILGTPTSGTATNLTGLPLTTGVTGTLPVANGGTGLTSGTSGGVLAYTASGTLASSSALTVHGVVIGGGAGAAPTSTAAGTSGQVLTSNGSSADPTFQTASAGGDVVATLVNAQTTALTANTTLTGSDFGHVIHLNPTSGNITITLPTITSNADKSIVFVVDATATKLVTLDANGSQTIDGALTRILWKGESAHILVTSAEWVKIGGKTIPMLCKMSKAGAQTITSGGSPQVITIDTVATGADNTGLMASIGSNLINILRPGNYTCFGTVAYNSLTAGGQYQARIQTSGAAGTENDSRAALAAGFPAPMWNDDFSLAASDTVQLGTFQNSGVDEATFAGACVLGVYERPSW